MAQQPTGLGPEDLYRATDPSSLGFETTLDLDDEQVVIGQDRAVSAIDFGISIPSTGYNIYALGPGGTGKRTILGDLISEHAAGLERPSDWVYVHNFDQSHRPCAIELAPSDGARLRDDMQQLVDELQAAISAAFESEEYERRRREIAQQVSQRQEERLDSLREQADERGYLMVRTPAGLAFVPKTEEGEALSREEYEKLDDEQQADIDEGLKELNEELQQAMRRVRQEEKAGRDELRELDEQVSDYAARHLVDEVKERWEAVPAVLEFLEAVLADVVENAEDFRSSEDESGGGIMGMMMSARQRRDVAFRKYQVNLIVDNSETSGAPLVEETNPTLQNLVGRVEHIAQFGALITDFNMIKPGSLHTANGGYLLLEARELLTKPYAWDGLKRSLKTGEIRIEDVAKQMGLATTTTLDPEPIPLSARIVLTGEPYLYYLLHELDPDFIELFKVKADFGVYTDRTGDNERLYGRFVASVCAREDLPPFDAAAVARVIEHSARLVEDADRLSSRFLEAANLVREAAHWSRVRLPRPTDGDGGASREPEIVVGREDVQRAIDERIYRSSRLEERIREMISDGTVRIETGGEIVGQVNGLSVIALGDYAFGRPSRITATHSVGDGDVVDIEREVEMGGPIHSKGVMILGGFLGSRYGSKQPLSLNLRLVFEQSYGGVEGDSASSAETYAALSTLSGLPLRQGFAVTGSIDQHGNVQAIGGVNEKIEGFWEVCKAMGVTGDQGVLIPRANVRNLMLNDDVRAAVGDGRFRIVPVETVDEGIHVLTGTEPGQPDEEGAYPEGTVNRLVADRLQEMAEVSRRHRSGDDSAEHTEAEHTDTENTDESAAGD